MTQLIAKLLRLLNARVSFKQVACVHMFLTDKITFCPVRGLEKHLSMHG